MKDKKARLGPSSECPILSSNSSSTLTSDSADELPGSRNQSKLKLPIHYSDSGYKSKKKYQKKKNSPAGIRTEDNLESFVSFIYNRLATGHSSFSSNHGLYVYSYFLWFEDISVRFVPFFTTCLIRLLPSVQIIKFIHFQFSLHKITVISTKCIAAVTQSA